MQGGWGWPGSSSLLGSASASVGSELCLHRDPSWAEPCPPRDLLLDDTRVPGPGGAGGHGKTHVKLAGCLHLWLSR